MLAGGYRVRSARGGLVSAVGDHNIEGVSYKDFAINNEMLKYPDCGITSMNHLKQIYDKRASEARFYRKLRELHTLLQVSSASTDFVRPLRVVHVESEQISQLGESFFDPFNWVVRTPEFYNCNRIEIY